VKVKPTSRSRKVSVSVSSFYVSCPSLQCTTRAYMESPRGGLTGLCSRQGAIRSTFTLPYLINVPSLLSLYADKRRPADAPQILEILVCIKATGSCQLSLFSIYFLLNLLLISQHGVKVSYVFAHWQKCQNITLCLQSAEPHNTFAAMHDYHAR